MTATRQTLWLCLLLVVFVVFGVWFALYRVSGDAEWGYITIGPLAVTGRIRLFQDEMIGERLPLPYYVIGLSQLLTGPSLLAARLCSLGLAVATIALSFVLGRSLAGPTCGFLTILLLITNGQVVGYYVDGSYFAFSALLIVAGLSAIIAGGRRWGSLLGMSCFVALAFSRAHLVVMVPAVLGYLLWRATSRWERVSLVLLTAVPPIVFFAWSPEHLKIFAYVPGLNRLVAPRGYRSAFALGAHALYPDPRWLDYVVPFAKRYVFWLVTTAAVLAGWIVASLQRRGSGPRVAGALIFIATLSIYTLLWQIVIVWRYPTTVPGWATTIAPLWAVTMAYGATMLLRVGFAPTFVRLGLAAVLMSVFAFSPWRSRDPSMPLVPPTLTAHQALARDAAVIRSVIPPGARVFLVGSPLPAYAARVSPYLQQLISASLLVSSDDVYAISRSGVWGRHEIEVWLEREAPYAIVSPDALSALGRGGGKYMALVGRIEALLACHFLPTASYPDTLGGRPYVIYRRTRACGPTS